MKTIIAASIALALSAGIAKADDVPSSATYYGNTMCASISQPAHVKEYDGWIVGFWDASNMYTRNDYDKANPEHGVTAVGRIGEGVDSQEIIKAVRAECHKDPHLELSVAVLNVYLRVLTDAVGKDTVASNP